MKAHVATEIVSPLAEYFDGHARRAPLKRRSVVFACVAALAIGPLAGTVFAADISTGAQDAEFGQGRLTTQQCDDVVTISLTTAWYAAGSYFRVTQLDLGDVNLTTCTGKTLTIAAYSAAGTQLDLNAGSGLTLSYAVHSATVATPVSGTSSSATIPLIVDGTINSVDVNKVTVQTTDTP